MDVPIVAQKTCSYPGCGKTYPATPEYFQRQKKGKYGVTSWCKWCKSKHVKDYRTEYPEKDRAQKAAYANANREKLRAKGRIYNRLNKESIAVKRRAYKAANKDKIHAYYIANREHIIAKTRAYRKTTRGKEVKHASNARRHARELSAEVTLTTAQWLTIKRWAKYRCAYCNQRFPSKALEQDHIVPLSKGGTHTIDNVVPCCRSCNAKKGVRAPLVPVQPLLLVAP